MPVWLWMSKRNYIAYLRYQMNFTAEAARWEWTKKTEKSTYRKRRDPEHGILINIRTE